MRENQIQQFQNQHFGKLTVIEIDSEFFFIGKEVAELLGYKNGSRDVNRHVDEEDRCIFQNYQNGTFENIPNRGVTIINESGLYTAILGSKKPEAKQFKRWVTSEVLPTIRKHGAYNVQPKIPTTQREMILLALAGNEETNQRIDAIEEQVTDLKENATLNPGEYGYIGRRINQRVSEVAKGYGNITQEQRGKLYKDINQGVKAITGVSTRTQLRTKHYEVVLEFINDWEPSTATKMQVRQTSFEF